MQVGDLVRLLVLSNDNNDSGKMYFYITQIARYSDGKPKSIRKFQGIAVEIYNEWQFTSKKSSIKKGMEIAFRKENIIEVPGWSWTPKELEDNLNEPAYYG